jgi:hypothetical protein
MYKLIKDCTNKSIQCINKQEGNVLLSIPFDPANTDYQEYLKFLLRATHQSQQMR